LILKTRKTRKKRRVRTEIKVRLKLVYVNENGKMQFFYYISFYNIKKFLS